MKLDICRKLQDLKILLIDDDEWIRDSLRLFLDSEGCHLLALETAEEAIEVLENDEYDIIFADYRLPGMDGLDFLKSIQRSHPKAMKVLITAYMTDEVITEAFRAGVHDFIEKPFNTHDIEDSLTRLIERNSYH